MIIPKTEEWEVNLGTLLTLEQAQELLDTMAEEGENVREESIHKFEGTSQESEVKSELGAEAKESPELPKVTKTTLRVYLLLTMERYGMNLVCLADKMPTMQRCESETMLEEQPPLAAAADVRLDQDSLRDHIQRAPVPHPFQQDLKSKITPYIRST